MSICDLIPQRPLTVFIWFLLAATVVALHGALEWGCQRVKAAQWNLDVTPLAPTQPHNVASFTVSLTLLLSAGYAALVLNFRRHKINDYRGRYRLWYPVVAALAMTAYVAGGNLGVLVESTVAELMRAGGLSGDRTWVLGSLAVAALIVLIRLVIEMRSSRAAVICLLAAAVSASFGLALTVSTVDRHAAELQQYGRSLTMLAASQWLLLALVVYARFVFLEAQGQIIQQATPKAGRARPGWLSRWKRARAERQNSTDAPATPDGADGKESPTGRTSKAPPAASPATAVAQDADDDSAEQDDEDHDEAATIKISRSERRRQRKEKRRQTRAA